MEENIRVANNWQVNSWRDQNQKHTAVQQPEYENKQEYDAVLKRLAVSPPLVQAQDILRLRRKLQKVAAGTAFIVQAGDCAERFKDCRADVVQAKLNLIEEMAARLAGHEHGGRTRQEIIKIGRIAGQYAKPRSNRYVTHQGQMLPNYFGDAVNSLDTAQRKPNPANLIHAYKCAAKTISFMSDYKQIFTSHEGLLLGFEQTQVRKQVQHIKEERYFNHSAHMLWIGARSCAIDSAHVELLRGVDNPIGIKVSADLAAEELVAIVQRLNSDNAASKLLLIVRLGKNNVLERLPRLIDACRAKNRQVMWMVDPMHGNTRQVAGVKTRCFDDICAELEMSFKVHRELGSYLGGVHLEIASAAVTECIGGGVARSDLSQRYESACDPRLNREQSLALTEFIASLRYEYQQR